MCPGCYMTTGRCYRFSTYRAWKCVTHNRIITYYEQMRWHNG